MLDLETDDTPHLPCADALVAGTVALMTAWAAPCTTCPLAVDQQRYLLSRKLLGNLLLLQQHPALSPGLRQVMAQARERWLEVATSPGVGSQHPPRQPPDHDDERPEPAPAASLH